ncbi:hypothetical protein [Rubritalea sp.]|uniref:hypothetical protein n=1 Tax=Rubritalea sp. TaxID=2109375 RepID=UPI003EF7D15E
MNYILAIVCACITGIAIGIGINHKLDDKNSVIMPADASSPLRPVSDFEHSSDESTFTELEIGENFDSTALSQMQEQLQQLIAQHEQMQNHQSELNREVNAIQFRLDTHSESFRPLRSERDTQTTPPTAPQGVSPLLPPLR